MFGLLGNYKNVFWEIAKRDAKQSKDQKRKFFKIEYTLNILPSVTYRNGEY